MHFIYSWILCIIYFTNIDAASRIQDLTGNNTRYRRQSDSNSEKFQCNSGQYIDDELLCDGRADCTDKSDETVESCSNFYCLKTTYRCSYGACVNINARCNGFVECIDGSDEAPCRNTTTTVKPLTPSPGSCVLPDNPKNGIYTVSATELNTHRPGDNVPQSSVLVTICNYNYNQNPADQKFSFCDNGIWTPSPVTCVHTPLSPCVIPNNPENGVYMVGETRATTVTPGSDVPQSSVLKIDCDSNYKPSPTGQKFSLCDNGTWTPTPDICISVIPP